MSGLGRTKQLTEIPERENEREARLWQRVDEANSRLSNSERYAHKQHKLRRLSKGLPAIQVA